jgi:hypothetical protein
MFVSIAFDTFDRVPQDCQHQPLLAAVVVELGQSRRQGYDRDVVIDTSVCASVREANIHYFAFPVPTITSEQSDQMSGNGALKTNPYFSQFGTEQTRQTLAALANEAAVQAK